ncbi:MAG TPA: hypothetical protein VHL11_14715, partial [Phototrophicaceae bacterium]|nr:hypothetical protein [Phototrophicaceae bacterium]
MKRFVLSLFLLLTLTITSIPVLAQDNPWSVLLVNTTTSKLLRVDQNGNQTTYDTGLPEYSLSSYGTSVSADGNRVAYCITDYTVPEKPVSTLQVYDLVAGTAVFTLDVGTRLNCSVGQHGFSPDGTQLAVSLLNYFNGDPNADTSLPLWEIGVYDLASATEIQSLDASSALVQGVYAMPDRWTVFPDIRYFDGTSVSFAPIPWGTEGSATEAFTWNLAAGTLIATPEWASSGSFLALPSGS